MKHNFAILPWEYRGANFDATPHAIASFCVAGKQSDFLLKMRDGIIYFKDSKRAPLFAIPHPFERQLRDEELVEAWREQIDMGNYGRFFWRGVNFLETSATTVVACIHRADYSGWICDAFQRHWLETPVHRDGKILNLWKDDIGPATWRAINRAKNALFNREMPVSERQPIPPHWACGSEAELRRIFTIIMQLYGRCSSPDPTRSWVFYATNPAWRGGLLDSFTWTYDKSLRFSPVLRHIRRLIDQQFVWTAMEWTYHEESSDSNPLHVSAHKGSPHWRGNYSIHTPTFPIIVPMVASLSQHEKLELSLDLRDWLHDKVTPRQSANWLAQTLD